MISPLVLALAASALHQYPFHGRLVLYLVPTYLLLLAEGVAAVGRPTGWLVTLALAGFLLYGEATEILWYKAIQSRSHPSIPTAISRTTCSTTSSIIAGGRFASRRYPRAGHGAQGLESRPAQLLVRRSGDHAAGRGTTPAGLIHRLFEIDATRAPLHPLLLQGWIRLVGNSETGARSLSVLCGVATIGLVFWISQMLFETRTGLWAAYLAALSPPLVYYSREARMYAWLVMVTCLCWGLLFSMHKADRNGSIARMIAYGLSLTAQLYSHPLGMLMAGTLGLGSFPFSRQFFGTLRWLAGASRALDPGPVLAAELLRSSSRVLLRTPADQLPGRHADWLYRGQFPGAGRVAGPDRVRPRTPTERA